ncbi:hypothetical protein OB69_01865 [Roseivirga seohaensis subsp. aquiponti]|uniref:DUF2279 domain-containing protein n=1 Tax=Roseivirga seohaensis subsp. aquiponti TaxID=1566026 RepID=A0A0L8AQ34_9BACT|nr:DUF2279 domain-containing protein [Roseivirga seohaensis]KOF04292.1 hypothetical protein OB69_01865 [Roseivirga seohaensis subsp. aquiponti]
MRLTALFLLSFLLTAKVHAYQNDSIPNKRLNTVLTVSGATYGATLIGLSQVWYKEQGLERFKFFNDNAEWHQVDKFGHFYSTYQFSRIGDGLLQWAGVEEKKAAFWASVAGTGLLLPIEILDGFSPDFGFSYGDMIANTAGSAFFLGQDLLWNEQRIKPKFSFHRTDLAQQSRHLLGNGLAEELIKDYNGQTYWFSIDIHAFAKKSNFPKWLNLGLGFGAEDMIRARVVQNDQAGFSSYRQLYFGIDFNLSYIKTDKKWLKTLLFILDGIHLPAPAFEFNSKKSKMHWFAY